MLVMNFIHATLLGIIAGMIGTVYITVLSSQEAFNFWWRFGAKYEKKWFYAPVWLCEKCFAGQFAAWFYLFGLVKVRKLYANHRFMHLPTFKISFRTYSVAEHLFAISTGIFMAIIFTHILKQIKKDE